MENGSENAMLSHYDYRETSSVDGKGSEVWDMGSPCIKVQFNEIVDVIDSNKFVDDSNLVTQREAYKAHLVDEFLESEDICRMDWPVSSPDLIHMKHAWDALEQAIVTLKPSPRTTQVRLVSAYNRYAKPVIVGRSTTL
ncbi:hypothetical protein TNCV_4765831 [Trichonephila clavipes]|nr:hypothetical protein TNCV_4765831 [Trichonephila clavipes]